MDSNVKKPPICILPTSSTHRVESNLRQISNIPLIGEPQHQHKTCIYYKDTVKKKKSSEDLVLNKGGNQAEQVQTEGG